MAIDFAALAARLLSGAESHLREWLPAGRKLGQEYCVGDLGGSEGDSLKINIVTGQWQDFATGEKGGDLIALYAAMHSLSQADAAKALGAGDVMPAVAREPAPKPVRKADEWTPILPTPESAPQPTNDYYRRGPRDASGSDSWIKLKFVARWAYRDADGNVLGYAVRFEWHEGDVLKKDIVPQVYCSHATKASQWRWRAFPEPRPLYGLDQLSKRLDAPVMIVEGEKKVEALKLLAPQYVGVCWPGGASSWRKANWAPLYGRAITLWPDADKQTIQNERQAEQFKAAIGDLIPMDHQPGMRAMWEIGHQLFAKCPTVKLIVPDDPLLPDGWDCADAVRDGWDWSRFKAWALPKVVNITDGGNDGRIRNGSERSSEDSGERSAGRRSGADDVQRAARPAEAGHDAQAAVLAVDASQTRPAEPRVDTQATRPDPRDDAAGASDAHGVRSTDLRSADGLGHDRASAADGRSGDREAIDGASSSGDGARVQASLQRSDNVSTDQGSDPRPATPTSQVGRWLAWGLDRNGNGLPLTNLSNAVRVLEADDKLQGLVWFDEFLGRLMRRPGRGEREPREWRDADDIALTLYMQRDVGLSKIGRDTVAQAIINIAMRDPRNCVKDFIERTTWDGTPRIESFIPLVFHCDDNVYTRSASRNFWISMLARVYQPGCKVDNMIVLEGAQGLLKSSALQAIATPWFAEQHESATNPKAFAETLQGKLLIEIAEMDSFSRAEVNTIKKVVSCQSDRYRAAYARYAADHPRQGIMAGSTNKDDWNKDETGARRFWPIACRGESDVAYVTEHRAQCFAEALVALRAGEPWWKMPDVETRTEQRKRYDADPWIEPLSHWLTGRTETTVNEIATALLRIEMREVDRTVQMRLAGVLRALGWVNNGNARRSGKVIKVWTPSSDAYGKPEEATEKVATEKTPFDE
jgi:predicted P-loop ATPase